MALALLLAGVASAAPDTTRPGSGVAQQARPAGGRILGIVPASGAARGASAPGFAGSGAASGGNLLYNGGPVMHTNRTYAIYWVPSGFSVSANYKTLIDRYFTDVAAASSSTSNVYASDTQYYDNVNGNILYSSAFGGSYLDTASLPGSGCVDKYTSVCLTDSQISSEIQRVASLRGWTVGPGSMFFMFTAKGVGSCTDGTSSTCAFSYYCAYHSSVGSGNSEVLYANMPYADTVTSTCDDGQHPNGDDADATLNVTSHEHNEAITDPLGTAWYDSAGNENGDKCAWNFGSALGSTSSGAYNQVINGHDYYLQQEWSNASSSCVLTYGAAQAPVNTALPVVSGTAQVGQTLSASAGAWSGTAPIAYAYQWQRCTSSCVGVGGNASTYVLSSADVGATMRVVVTASNSVGSSSATSAATGTVQAGSGSLTITLASGSDNGEVDVNGAQSSGYPPTAAPSVFTGSVMTAGRRLAYGTYSVFEPLLRFDTSGVPAGATITSATLKLYVNRSSNGDGRNLVGDWLPSAVWPLAAADWSLNPVGNALAATPISSIATGALDSFALTGLGSISTSGYTTIRLQIDGGQPSGDNYVQFATYQDSSAPKPQLVLTYTTP